MIPSSAGGASIATARPTERYVFSLWTLIEFIKPLNPSARTTVMNEYNPSTEGSIEILRAINF